jgi:glycosyltransferase involved in cell wall biosynthesis
MSKQPFVSVIIPCRNEEDYIHILLNNILAQDYPENNFEVLVLDGLSDDKTPAIVKEYSKKYPKIQYYENTQKIVPFALNKGIKLAKGEVIVRMDAHSEYPNDYLSKLVYHLYHLNADNVGGSCLTLPARDTLEAKLIAEASSSSFGIGDSQFRLRNTDIKEVDTVPFGCYKREVFDRIGLFDEDLVRNQDDELNARLTKKGGKIYLIPFVKINYYARKSIPKMIKMFFQYGYFKPLVNKKVKKPATLRQFVPLFFTLYLFFLLASGFAGTIWFLIFLIPFLFYVLLSLIVSLKVSIRRKQIEFLFLLPGVFFLIHISYGWGYLRGIFKHIILGSKSSKQFSTNR